MFRAHQHGGYTLEELANLVGLTRERVRQRIRDHAKNNPP
jgi:DNA-directed RNA polymerase sigma subunit (sigma70/sigma32)